MHKTHERQHRWRQLGWLALLAFTTKGVVTTSLIIWALVQAIP